MKDIKEYFHAGFKARESMSKENLTSMKEESDKSSITGQLMCRQRNRRETKSSIDIINNDGSNKTLHQKIGLNNKERGQNKHEKFYPKEGQSEYGIYNPIWLILGVMNIILDMVIDLYSVFWWMFKKVFTETYKSIAGSVSFGDYLGIQGGTKYCFNLIWYRYLIIVLCPPAGVFMAYGFRGWLQIIICCIASLFYYFPGLVYALIVINRSDVSEYMKLINSSECNDSGLGGIGLFVTDQKDMPKCSKKTGDTCTVKGKAVGGDSKVLDCCMNPKLMKDGSWKLDDGTDPYTFAGSLVNNANDAKKGETYCNSVDYKKLTNVPGKCVWKETGRP